VLFNNAGVLASFNVLTATSEQMAQDFNTNFFGTLAATKAFLPAREREAKAGGAASVVNVLSVASLANVPALAAYSASKAAAASITQALRVELAKKRVSVHGVFAGSIDTDMVRGMEMAKTSPEDVATGILEGLARGEDDISPDPMSQSLFDTRRRDPKAVERQLGSMSG
jgi:short-subunit dehydrogenase